MIVRVCTAGESNVSDAQIAGGHKGRGLSVGLGPADWLSLAAAPSFAVMALVTGVWGGAGGMPALLCSSVHASPLGGMVVMYLLMSVFHLPPWLRRSRNAGRR
jgi:hypothetical protein